MNFKSIIYGHKMAKFLLLGDSNIANSLQHQAVLGKGQYDFKKCTTRGLFVDKILSAQSELVVIAGIDCIVNEALTAPRESERCVSLVLNNLMSKVIEKLEGEEVANMVVAIASPLYWADFSEEVKKSLQFSFKQIRKDWKHKIKFLPPCPGVTYLADRVHLDELSGVRYTNHIIKKSCSLLKMAPNPAHNPSWADEVELQQMEDEEMEQEDTQPEIDVTQNRADGVIRQQQRSFSSTTINQPLQVSSQSHLFPTFAFPPPSQQPSMASLHSNLVPVQIQGTSNHELLQKIEELSKRMDSVEDKSYYDNLTFAAIKEDQDEAANQRNLCKVTLTGVVIKDFHKMAENEKPAAMKEAVIKIINLVTAEEEKVNRTVVFTRHRNGHIRNAKAAVIEARFQEVKQAVDFRKDFVAKHKALREAKALPDELEGVSTFPIQTVATRVRATLLKAMAKVVEAQSGPNISSYCQQFLTRPMLKIVNKSTQSTNVQSFAFVDAVLKLKSHNDLHRVALDEAYQIAGSNFRGRLEQHFIILKDK